MAGRFQTLTSQHDPSGPEADRGELRRQQILDAATECFRRQGFHSTSMATISKTAKMSVGHIYHYFDNKEAIIAAIVAKDVDELVTLFADLDRSADILDAMVDCVDEGFKQHTDLAVATLGLEIVAEAARNQKMGEIVQAADQAARRIIIDTLRKGFLARGRQLSETELAARFEVTAAMFEGLSQRIIRNPGLDRAATLAALRQALTAILNA